MPTSTKFIDKPLLYFSFHPRQKKRKKKRLSFRLTKHNECSTIQKTLVVGLIYFHGDMNLILK